MTASWEKVQLLMEEELWVLGNEDLSTLWIKPTRLRFYRRRALCVWLERPTTHTHWGRAHKHRQKISDVGIDHSDTSDISERLTAGRRLLVQKKNIFFPKSPLPSLSLLSTDPPLYVTMRTIYWKGNIFKEKLRVIFAAWFVFLTFTSTASC